MRKLFALLLILSSVQLFAQKTKEEPKPVAATSPIDAKVVGMKKYSGYFDFYYDEKQDKIHLLIDKFDTEFLYVPSLTAGVGSNDIGLDRNQLNRERIVKFERRGPKILLTEPNYFYRAVSNNEAERKAVAESDRKSTRLNSSHT